MIQWKNSLFLLFFASQTYAMNNASLLQNCKDYLARKHHGSYSGIEISSGGKNTLCHSSCKDLDVLLTALFASEIQALTHHPFKLCDTGVCSDLKTAIKDSPSAEDTLLFYAPCKGSCSLSSLCSHLSATYYPMGYIVYPTENTEAEITMLKALMDKKVKIFKEDFDIDGLSLSRIFWTVKSHQLHEAGAPQKKSAHAITYTIPKSRMGDKLLAFLHASWLSYKYQIPLHVKPFRSSSAFHLDYYAKKQNIKTTNTVILTKESDIEVHKKTPTLFEVPFFASNKEIIHDTTLYPLFEVDWQDTTFKHIIRRSLAQIHSRYAIAKAPNTFNIGVHIRTGVGKDSDAVRSGWKLKFPPPFILC